MYTVDVLLGSIINYLAFLYEVQPYIKLFQHLHTHGVHLVDNRKKNLLQYILKAWYIHPFKWHQFQGPHFLRNNPFVHCKDVSF